MKLLSFKSQIIAIMLITGVSGCSKKSESTTEQLPPIVGGLCSDAVSFMESISRYSSDNNIYVIKGTVLDKVEYGLKISLIEDFKGNFPKNKNTFTVWGDGTTFIESNRLDYLTSYNKQDVLIMLLTPARDLSFITPPEHKWLEKPEDYTTLTCTYSVVQLSDGYVTGYILPYEERDTWWDNMSREELSSYIESLPPEEQSSFTMDKMPYDEFQRKLNELLITQ